MPNPVTRFLGILSTGLRGEIVPATVGGVASAGQIPALDPVTGTLPFSMLPPDIDSAGEAIVASEALNGPLVNVWNNAGVTAARNADAAGNKPATGFITGAVASGATVEVYYAGKIPGLTGLTPGAPLFLGAAGAVTTAPTTTAGQTLQNVGTATSATGAAFARGEPITRA